MAASVGFFGRVQMLLFATAHVDCTDNTRERVCTESFLREKNPVPHRGLEPASVLRLAFQLDALPSELSPLVVVVKRGEKC